jgi:tartrate/fumarate subfamily iron-sulfur-dependent hydro-lyase beta chain
MMGSDVRYINLPVEPQEIQKLKVGDIVYLSGLIMTARDQAHKKIIEIVDIKKQILPVIFKDLKNCAIYHCGPIINERESNPTKKGKGSDKDYVIYSGGPTTSSRMEQFQERVCNLLEIKIVIGKGGMKSVRFDKFKGVYLSFTGGCGAIFVSFTKKIKAEIWPELGMPEAVWIIEIEKFGPLIVSQDSMGNSLYNFSKT